MLVLSRSLSSGLEPCKDRKGYDLLRHYDVYYSKHIYSIGRIPREELLPGPADCTTLRIGASLTHTQTNRPNKKQTEPRIPIWTVRGSIPVSEDYKGQSWRADKLQADRQAEHRTYRRRTPAKVEKIFRPETETAVKAHIRAVYCTNNEINDTDITNEGTRVVASWHECKRDLHMGTTGMKRRTGREATKRHSTGERKSGKGRARRSSVLYCIYA